jgi:hypothetical protein
LFKRFFDKREGSLAFTGDTPPEGCLMSVTTKATGCGSFQCGVQRRRKRGRAQTGSVWGAEFDALVSRGKYRLRAIANGRELFTPDWHTPQNVIAANGCFVDA